MPALVHGALFIILDREPAKEQEEMSFAQNIDDMLREFRPEEQESLLYYVDYESSSQSWRETVSGK